MDKAIETNVLCNDTFASVSPLITAAKRVNNIQPLIGDDVLLREQSKHGEDNPPPVQETVIRL